MKKVLFVEDEPNDVELISGILSEYFFYDNIIIFKNGDELLNYLLQKKQIDETPLFIVLDLKLPGLSGAEVLRKIKSDDKLKYIPVIILTSSRENKDIEECYHSGANAYVVKPIDFKDFEIAIKSLGIFWGTINVPPFNR